MTGETQGAACQCRQAVLDEGLEAFLQRYFRQHGIAGLLQPQDQLFADGGRFEKGGLPETFFHPVAVEQHQPRDTHGADGLQHAFEHLRTRHREQQGQRQLGRRVCVEADLQLGLLGVETEQLAAAHQAAQATDPQAVAALGPVHFAQVLQAPALQAYTVRRDEVAVFQQQQVHGRGAGGWSPRKLSSSSAVGRRTRPPNSRPTSNSSHIGTASMVCENTSGGVRIMPTTKQPTMT